MRKTSFPGVTRIGPGSYRLRITWVCPKTGRRRESKRSVRAKSARDAFAKRCEILDELKNPAAEAERVTVADYAESWLKRKLRSLKPSTRNLYASVLDTCVLPTLGDYYMDAVTQKDIHAWLASMRVAPDTLNGRLRVLRTLFGDAVYELELPRDPTARIQAAAAGEKRNKTLSSEELASVLVAVRDGTPQWYPLVLTLATTGARFGEVSALKWCDVDFEDKTLHIRRAHWRQHVSTTKTGSTRVLPLTDELASVLRQHRMELVQTQNPGLHAGWVFPSATGTLLFPGTLQKPLNRAVAQCGIDRKVTPHWFRHTLNNLLRQVTHGEVQRAITGHVTEAMSAHYSHVANDEKRVAIGAVFDLVATRCVPISGHSSSGVDDTTKKR